MGAGRGGGGKGCFESACYGEEDGAHHSSQPGCNRVNFRLDLPTLACCCSVLSAFRFYLLSVFLFCFLFLFFLCYCSCCCFSVIVRVVVSLSLCPCCCFSVIVLVFFSVIVRVVVSLSLSVLFVLLLSVLFPFFCPWCYSIVACFIIHLVICCSIFG